MTCFWALNIQLFFSWIFINKMSFRSSFSVEALIYLNEFKMLTRKFTVESLVYTMMHLTIADWLLFTRKTKLHFLPIEQSTTFVANDTKTDLHQRQSIHRNDRKHVEMSLLLWSLYLHLKFIFSFVNLGIHPIIKLRRKLVQNANCMAFDAEKSCSSSLHRLIILKR